MSYAVHPRVLLPDARQVIAEPDLHDREAVMEAADLLIKFGTLEDLSNGRAVRDAIICGDLRPGRIARRRRWIITAAITFAFVWALAAGLAHFTAAQEAGTLPSVQELIFP
ncbi:hypothetical protein [Leisingera daeponensis]|uniref:hypothetical protein n=1 Tax=Leisingera daeponensis TaxID=405746 RepID=UPI001C96403C|nr:hypothetical protein [Leisingera daeponensis]MBY6055404.1 hypothetical protein [Leisingera daeponensis]